MKTLVVYESFFGNTKELALQAASVLEGDVISIESFKE